MDPYLRDVLDVCLLMLHVIAGMVIMAIVPRTGEAQRPEVRVFQDAPAASWIFPPDVSGDAYGVFHFRRTFELFPDAGNRQTPQFWTGLRPATPSNVPLLGRTRYGNLFLDTGHGTLGWTMACGSARALADLVAGRRPGVEFAFT